MKKYLFFTAALCLFSLALSTAQAQFLGAKLGYSSATLAGSDVAEVDPRTGISAGLFALFPINPVVSLQPQAMLTSKGSKQTVVDNGQSYDAEVKLTYIEVPVLIVLHAPMGEAALRPVVFTGPSMGFNISAKADELIPGQGLTEIDLKEATKETDLSWIFGAGLGVPVGKHLLTVSAQYAVGMSTIDDSVEDAFDVKNRVFSIEIGFGFGIGEE